MCMWPLYRIFKKINCRQHITYDLWFADDDLAGLEGRSDALAGSLQPPPRCWISGIAALRPSGALVLHSAPATEWVAITLAGVTGDKAGALLNPKARHLYTKHEHVP